MPNKKKGSVSLPFEKEEIIRDYRLAYQSRQASLIGRREVLSGKAKFGIFGDGKEIPQLAIARAFRKGDWRSGYYRDQTWMFALGVTSIQEFFAQLYSHADVTYDPGGATAYMMQEVIEKQGGYFHLDSPAKTLSGTAHRPAYGSDGDYWSKPNAETVFDAVYEMMNEVNPKQFPVFK
jgi:hypothetical protein